MSLQQRAPPCSCAIWNVVWMFSWSSLQLVPSCISVLFMWCIDNNSGEWTEPWVENLVHRCPFCVPKCFFPEPTKIMGLIFKLNFFFLMTKIVQFHLCLFLPFEMYLFLWLTVSYNESILQCFLQFFSPNIYQNGSVIPVVLWLWKVCSLIKV